MPCYSVQIISRPRRHLNVSDEGGADVVSRFAARSRRTLSAGISFVAYSILAPETNVMPVALPKKPLASKAEGSVLPNLARSRRLRSTIADVPKTLPTRATGGHTDFAKVGFR